MPDRRVEIDVPSNNSASPRRSLAVGIWSVLLIVDVVLVTRRLSGEFATPIPGLLALFSTVTVAIISWTAWFACASGIPQRSDPPSKRWIPQGISVAVLVLWAWSISAAASPLTYGLLLAVILMHSAVVLTYHVDLVDHSNSQKQHRQQAEPLPAVLGNQFADKSLSTAEIREPTRDPCDEAMPHTHEHLFSVQSSKVFGSSDEEFNSELSDEESDDNLTLWLSRRLIEDGEQIEGWVRVDFAPGQRETLVHVSFCPPLSGTPKIETEDLDGTGLEIRVAAAFPFGARLSVRRSDLLDEPHSDRIGFVAQSSLANRAA